MSGGRHSLLERLAEERRLHSYREQGNAPDPFYTPQLSEILRPRHACFPGDTLCESAVGMRFQAWFICHRGTSNEQRALWWQREICMRKGTDQACGRSVRDVMRGPPDRGASRVTLLAGSTVLIGPVLARVRI